MGANINNNIFKILVATDNHLGYLEKDAERGDDSYNTFEEILQLAVEQNVDFILLGGDLFHDNKPSRNSILRCMDLLRKYTLGDKPVPFDFVSDPTENFPHLRNPNVNYLDPNLNVSIPVFSIHGNHDDPSGLGQHSPLEMLSAAGLLNYFGRVDDLNEVKVSPLLLTKGQTKLSLYGLSAIKDERLFRLFRENKVKMLRPKEGTDDWFNILVLHQNHTRHSLSNYIPEEFLDPFLELVIWGHEHECIKKEWRSSDDSFHVFQPGSSVATSLCAGEAVPKHAAILEVDDRKRMRITVLPLRTVRPFIFEDLCLKDHDLAEKVVNKKSHPVEEFVEEYVRGMIERAKQLHTGNRQDEADESTEERERRENKEKQQPKKPLIRLRVEYTDESQMFNICRFGYKFSDVVANPDNIILFKKFKKEQQKQEGAGIDKDVMDSVFNSEVPQAKVEDLVAQYFASLDEDDELLPLRLRLLSERGLACAVGQFVDKDDRDALRDIFTHQIEKTARHLATIEDLDETNIEEAIESYHLQRVEKKEQDEEEAVAALSNPNRKNMKHPSFGDPDDSDLEILEENSVQPTSTRGSRGGRGSRGAASSRGVRSANKTALDMVGDDDEDLDARGRGGGRGRARGRGRGRARGGSATPAPSKTPSMMESFIRPPSARRERPSQRRGATFDSDSDSN